MVDDTSNDVSLGTYARNSFASETTPILNTNDTEDGKVNRSISDKNLSLNLSSETRTFINITKAFVGAASFELPWAFMQAGFVGSIVGVTVLACLSQFSLTRLAVCGRMVPNNARPTYPEVGYQAFGMIGSFIAWFGAVAMTLGTCGSYVVFISSVGADLTKVKSQALWTVIVCAVLIPFSWLRSYKFLAPTSVFGIAALLFALAFTIADCFQHHTVALTVETKMVKLDTYPLFLGNAAFLYLMSTAILPLEQGMEKREKFHRPFTLSIFLVTLANMAFGFIAYLAYGDCDNCQDVTNANCCTQSNVISNVSTKGSHSIVVAVKVLLTVDLFFTTMLYLFPMTELLERALFNQANFGKLRTEILRNTLRASVVCSIGLIAQGIPVFGLLTGLSGGFGNNIIGLILPPVMYFQLRKQNGYWKQLTSSNIFSGNWAAIGLLFEIIGLVVVFIFGVTVLILSTSAFAEAITAKSANSTDSNITTTAASMWSDDL